jgi:DNA helicase II / ATP-dependent DNA helicase PcrA
VVRWLAAELKELFAAYVEAKQKHNVLDYDDPLLYWAQMMSDAAIADDVGGRFDHVLVDEYQDTNRLQSSVLLALKPAGRGLTVVGDDAQSIYSFRAATVRNILDFPEQFSPKAEIVTLDRNYRSTQPILSAANGVIDLARKRFTKNLWTDRISSAKPRLVAVRDEADQARYIVERILENREEGALLKQQAVLFRTSSHSGPLEIELTRLRSSRIFKSGDSPSRLAASYQFQPRSMHGSRGQGRGRHSGLGERSYEFRYVGIPVCRPRSPRSR